MNGKQLVEYAQAMAEFAEVDQRKFLAGLTVARSYYYLSKKEVIEYDADDLKARAGETFEGVSKFKQAFGTDAPFQLLVRHKLCCCQSCIARDFGDCELKVSKLGSFISK